MSLSKKLTLSFVLSILISILIISFVSNSMINDKFDIYLIEERNKKFEKIRNDINELFLEKKGNIISENIINYASMEGIYIEIKDSQNNIICHSSNNKFNKNMMGNMMRRHQRMMNKNLQNSAGNYLEKSFPLIDNDKVIGTLIIGYIDNAYLTESALLFKNTLSKSFIISGIITIVLGFLISIFLSKGLTKPLINITNTANQIRKGNLKSRSNVSTKTKEILDLSHSINYLGETLENQENLRKRYASDIAHELRTPLTTLKSHLEAIIDGIWEPNDEHLNIILNEINRLAKLVEDLKNTFKIWEGQLNVNRTNFNLSNEMENILSSFKPLFEKENYILEYFIEEDIEICMDKNKLKQIMYNLLSNALKYLNKNGKVLVTLAKEKNNIKITVEDNGTGIKEEDLPFIFERFYRSDTSRNRKTGGTGLGLPITKALVEAHGGFINVESKLGKGTRFTILF